MGTIPAAATSRAPGEKPDRGGEREKPDRGREIDTAVHPASPSDRRLAELETGLRERDAQLAEAERTIAEAAGELGRRARRKVLERREALAEAHARLEREVAHALVLEAEIDRQISMREAAGAEAEQRFRHLEAQAKRDIAEAKAALERTRVAAAADMDRARTDFEQTRRQLEVALQDTKAAVDEARTRLDEERASRKDLEQSLAAVVDAEAASTREAAGGRRELELSQSELERLRDERTRLRSELAAQVRSREASESRAVEAKPGSGPQDAEQRREGDTASVVEERVLPAETPPSRFGRSKRRAAEAQTQLEVARGEARAERERAASLSKALERATTTERQLRADIARLSSQSSDAASSTVARADASRESGAATLRPSAGGALEGLLHRIRARTKRTS